MNALQNDALTETYKDMDDLISKLANDYSMTYGIEFHEMKAEANLWFVHAMKSYDENKGKVSTWITHVISGHLKNYLRNVRKIQFIPSTMYDTPQTSIIDIIDEVGDDGKTLISLVLDTPSDLFDLMAYPNPKFLRACIKRHVTKACGWSIQKYKTTFKEVTEALYA